MGKVLRCLCLVALLTTQTAAQANPVSSLVTELAAKAPHLNPQVLKLALIAYYNAAKQGYSHSPILTVVDYSQPSFEKRMWVFDLQSNQLLFNTYVAQGKGTGLVEAQHFSNQAGSRASSIGLYQTGDVYYGHDGYSLHLYGLDQGFNNNAYKRDIVVHGAAYVSPDFVKSHLRAGLSWGCLAVSERIVKPLINTIKGGTLIFAYYPESQWLQSSQFLHTTDVKVTNT